VTLHGSRAFASGVVGAVGYVCILDTAKLAPCNKLIAEGHRGPHAGGSGSLAELSPGSMRQSSLLTCTPMIKFYNSASLVYRPPNVLGVEVQFHEHESVCFPC
jgi:hypothetical protein